MGGSESDKLMRGRFRRVEGFSSLRPSPFQPDPLPSALLLELKIVATNEMEHIYPAKTKPALTGYTCHRFLFPSALNV